ncbi:MAG: hypothetical protein DRN78_06230, partial [Thermoproteota archaeon]
MNLREVPRLLARLGKLDVVACYLAERIIREEETLLSIFETLDQIGSMFYREPLKYDCLTRLLSKKSKGIEFEIGSTWVVYNSGEINIGVQKPPYNLMTIDEWLTIWMGANGIEDYKITMHTPYTWISDIMGKLKEMNFSVRSLANWYIEKLKDASVTLNKAYMKAIKEDVDEHVKEIKIRIESPIRKYLLPYYIWLMETNHRLNNSSKRFEKGKGTLADWFLSCLSILANDKVRISMLADSLTINYILSESKVLVGVELVWDEEKEVANVLISVFSPYTHEEDIECFIEFL